MMMMMMIMIMMVMIMIMMMMMMIMIFPICLFISFGFILRIVDLVEHLSASFSFLVIV